ncbi:MAG: CRISPR-associated endonuclease Cas6 [Cyanobacteriota bacterium]
MNNNSNINVLEKSNIKTVKLGVLKLDNINLNRGETHLLRGYLGNLFKEYDLVHNHNTETGKEIYRYPLIQYKVLDNKPTIIAIGGEAIDVLTKMLIKTKEINIKGLIIPVYEKNFTILEQNYGCSDELITYEFINPWIGLNQQNYIKYKTLQDVADKEELINKCLIGNIMSISKYLNYTVQNKLEAKNNLKEHAVILKGNNVLGFKGYFKTNFKLPDYIGLGKSVSRGYGCIKKVI